MAANCWGLSWKGTAGSWLTSWAFASTPPPLAAPTVQVAGKPRKRRLFVEIDGQAFEVRDIQHAQALLDRARELAQSVAQTVAAETIERVQPKGAKPIRLPTPAIRSNDPELAPVIQQARKAINDVYRSAAIDTELAVLLARKLAEEDDEDALLLLM